LQGSFGGQLLPSGIVDESGIGITGSMGDIGMGRITGSGMKIGRG
jgi:hypothetical protein